MIELLQSKCPQQENQTGDLNLYKYLHVLNHLIEKCFMYKKKVMELVCEKKIKLDIDAFSSDLVDMASEDVSSIVFG